MDFIMEKVLEFLKNAGTWYIASVEGDQPRVRPFGAQMAYNGKIYFITNNQKKVYAQLKANPKFEISGMDKTGHWIRLEGKAVEDTSDAAKEAMLEANPGLKGMYSVGDGIMAVFSMEDATATIASFTEAPEVIKL